MRKIIRVGWLLWGLSVMSVTSAIGVGPSYVKLRSGTLAAGGVDDLLEKGRALILVPAACSAGVSVLELGVGFVVDEEFDALDVSGAIQAPRDCTAEIHFRNFNNGQYESFDQFDLADARFVSEEIPVDSATYREPSTSEVELFVVIRCFCGPPPTDQDDVAVQNLTIGPTPK